MKNHDPDIAARQFEHLMQLARFSPGYIEHVRHRAQELEASTKPGTEYPFHWYDGLAARVDATLKAEGLLDKDAGPYRLPSTPLPHQIRRHGISVVSNRRTRR